MFQPSAAPLHVVAVGLHGLRYLFEALAPEYRRHVQITLLERAYDDAVAGIKSLAGREAVDVVVAAGSNGDYLRQHLALPVVLVKVSGFDVMEALVRAKSISDHIAVVMYASVAPELADFVQVLDIQVALRHYETEAEARQCVQQLKAAGVRVVVAPGLVVDLAEAEGLQGILLYSRRLVREALEDAVELAKHSRHEQARRERISTILGNLRDAVLAVDLQERIEVINPAMASLLGQAPDQLVGRMLSEVNRDLSLGITLQSQKVETERIQRMGDKTVVMTRLPIIEQGKLTGAVLICQDSAAIQRLDRNLRSSRKARAIDTRYSLDDLVGNSLEISRLRVLASVAAKQRSSILITGETGTGKEVLAQGIHAASERSQQPFIAVNCAAFPDQLLESELFGYVDGAFTGAGRGGKMGLFEAAHTGTIFLDEIGEMPMVLQTRLLRVLQEREVLRVGAVAATPVDVRVIAATHRNLAHEVESGRFRRDLFYRLNILPLILPPLRERRDDFPLLVRALVRRLSGQFGQVPEIMPALVEHLSHVAVQYSWPGNVRELENVIERMVVLAMAFPDRDARALVAEVLGVDSWSSEEPATGWGYGYTQQLENARILQVLESCGGNHKAAASILGVSRTTLWRRLKRISV
ncbi:MAG: propionate catabolism operon regulatory protein PrpR [Pusillimonas sp.]